MTFDLASLRASFKRKREDAEAMHVDAPGSKKGRFEAASLQVSRLYLGTIMNTIANVLQLLEKKRKWLQVCGNRI